MSKENCNQLSIIDNAFKNGINQKNIVIKEILLKYTKIKEPITKGKLKWHGIKLCQLSGKPNVFWLTQKGKQIGLCLQENIIITYK